MIYKATIADAREISQMALLMWADNTVEELSNEFAAIIDSEDGVVFLKSIDNQLVGFAQCQLRHDYVEGTDSSPVGYLEGVFIRPEYRKHGYAKELLEQCEEWARQKGCTEFASDCELENEVSLKFHLKLGFAEANRVICFTKRI